MAQAESYTGDRFTVVTETPRGAHVVLAQRLVRTICVKCKTPYTPSEEEIMSLALRGRDISNQRFYYGKGCEFCKNTGYKGRTAIFELLTVDDAIRELVLSKASANQIRSVAQRALPSMMMAT